MKDATVTIRVPSEVKDKLRHDAAMNDRSMSQQVLHLIKRGDANEKTPALYQTDEASGQ